METHFGHQIRILHWCTDQTMTAALAQMDLTAAQGHIMGYLAHRKTPPCCKDIEDAFHLTHPTVSGLLTRLERKGFIAFFPDPADKRCKRIRMLERGQRCTDTMARVIAENEERMVRDFTPQQRQVFSEYLQRAIENMGGGCRSAHPKEE